jgi:membrane protein YdbS with pleckstrin-like domain
MNALDPRVRVVWGVRALLLAAVLGAGLAVVDRFVAAVATPLAAGVVVVTATAGLLHAHYRYRRWRYALEADALVLQRGVVTHVDSAVPYVRIQHVDTRRGPLDRVAGVTAVVVFTAGSRGADVTVPGLDPERARALQRRLRERAVESGAGDAV